MNFFTAPFQLPFLQIVLLFLPAILNLWGIWHAFHHTFPTPLERILWVCACIFLPILGGIAYLLIGWRHALKDASGQE